MYTSYGLGDDCTDYGICSDTDLNVYSSTPSPAPTSNLPTLYVAPGAMTPAQAAGAGSNIVFESSVGQYKTLAGSSGYGGYGGSGSPIYTSTSSGTDIWSALTAALSSAGNILGIRYSVPQLNPGQTITTTAYGTSMSQAAAGQPAAGITSLSSTLSSALPLLLLAGVAVAVLGAMNKGH